MKVLYIAEDGTQFDCEEDCAFYEIHTMVNSSLQKKLKGFNREGKEVSQTDWEDWWENSDYIVVHEDLTDKERDFFKSILGFTVPIHEGIYRYDKYDEWLDYNEEKKKFESRWAPVRSQIERMLE